MALNYAIYFNFTPITHESVLSEIIETHGPNIRNVILSMGQVDDERFRWTCVQPGASVTAKLRPRRVGYAVSFENRVTKTDPNISKVCVFMLFSSLPELKYELDALARDYSFALGHDCLAVQELNRIAGGYEGLGNIAIRVSVSALQRLSLAWDRGDA